jgi:predicted neuraminidase
MPRVATLAALLAATLCCAIAALRPPHVSGLHPNALVPSVPVPVREEPHYRHELLPVGGHAMVHVPSLAQLPDGRLAAAWYAGSKECAPDVSIFFSTERRGPAEGWTTPHAVVTPRTASAELRRYVRKVGNAVLFSDLGGRLWLVYVTIPFGGWSVSSLNVKVSDDQGETWSPSRRLTVSPFFNLSTLVKNKPLLLAGGGLALPVSHELLTKSAQLLWLEGRPETGPGLRLSAIGGAGTYLQGAVVALDEHRALALLRSKRGWVGRSISLDAGSTWSPPEPSDLPNPDSGLDALLLSSGKVLFAGNSGDPSRSALILATSSDLGHTWKRVATLEDDASGTFSYPFLFRARDGAIHLLYSYRGKGIKHVVFNEAWLESQPTGGR